MVGRILDNPSYAGLCHLDGDFIPATWEPVIDPETWEELRRRRLANKRRISNIRATGRRPALLSGLIYCGQCGHRLHRRAKPSARGGAVYRCNYREQSGIYCPGGAVGAERAERVVSEAFLGRSRFSIVGDGEEGQFTEPRLAWDAASLEDKRRLLRIAIWRVEMLPWPSDGRRRPAEKELRLVWADDGRSEKSERLLSFVWKRSEEVETSPPRGREVSSGRVERLRCEDVHAKLQQRQNPADVLRRYQREWGRFQQEKSGE